MDPEDFVTPEVGITAAVVAAVATPQVRKIVRRGAVLGVAGVLMAGDAVTSFARGLGQGASVVGSQVGKQAQGGPNGHGAGSPTTGTGEQPAPEGEAKNVGEPS